MISQKSKNNRGINTLSEYFEAKTDEKRDIGLVIQGLILMRGLTVMTILIIFYINIHTFLMIF